MDSIILTIIGIIIGGILSFIITRYYSVKGNEELKQQNSELQAQTEFDHKNMMNLLMELVKQKQIPPTEVITLTNELVQQGKLPQQSRDEIIKIFDAVSISSQVNVVIQNQDQDQRFKDCVYEHRRRGTPKFLIDSYSDLTKEQKVNLFDRVMKYIREERGGKYISKNNPYR